MNIVFYLQPYIVKMNPPAHEWQYLKYRTLASGFKRLGFNVSFIMNDLLKAKYIGTGPFEYISPSDFGIEFNVSDYIEGWREVLTNDNRPEANRFLNLVFDKTKPELVYIWNFDAALKRICKERRIPLLHQELGLIRKPTMLYQVDFEGLLWDSSLGKLFSQFKDKVSVDDKLLDHFIFRVRGTIRYSRGDILNKLNLSSNMPTILIPLQVEADTNIVEGSPFFRTMTDFISFIFERLAERENYQIIIKKHPCQTEVTLPPAIEELRNVAVVSGEVSNMDIINASDFIFTINSTSGFEALVLSKPVFTFGKSPFSHLGFTRDIDPATRRIDTKNATGLENKQDLRKFLYFTIFHYHLHEREMWNAQFYVKIWKDIMEARNNPENFYLVTKGVSTIAELETMLEEQQDHVAELETMLEEQQDHVAELETRLKEEQNRIVELESTMNQLQNSLGYRMLTRYRCLKESLLPSASRRRTVYNWCLERVKTMILKRTA